MDTGSNAIRFQAQEFLSPQRSVLLEYERVPVRLGHQVFLNGRLAQETMDAAVRAFSHFQQRMEALEIQHHRAVATSAVREARNGPLLVDRILRESDIRLEVIGGSEEARLVHTAVASRIDLSGGKWVLADLGGGSVEVSLVDDVGMLWSESHTMGSVRLLEELAETDSDPGRFQRLLEEYVSVIRIPAPSQYWEPAGFIATGGNMEALAKLSAAPPDDLGVSRVPLPDLRSAVELLTRLSFRERMLQLNLKEDRADVILPAALVYLRLAELTGAREILVPHVGVKDGLLLDLMHTLTSHAGAEARYESQLTAVAISLGRRFMFDEAHGTHVARLALSLFDQLGKLHGLGPRDRLLLKVAALLHDVGTFVSYKKHHRHALYLISRSDLPGLSSDEILTVANVARYHRKSPPSLGHPDYARLPQELRVRVDQLAAILRIADALDRQRLQLVKSVQVQPSALELLLHLEGEGDLLLERWSVSRKQGLFQDTFGLQVRVGNGKK